ERRALRRDQLVPVVAEEDDLQTGTVTAAELLEKLLDQEEVPDQLLSTGTVRDRVRRHQVGHDRRIARGLLQETVPQAVQLPARDRRREYVRQRRRHASRPDVDVAPEVAVLRGLEEVLEEPAFDPVLLGVEVAILVPLRPLVPD